MACVVRLRACEAGEPTDPMHNRDDSPKIVANRGCHPEHKALGAAKDRGCYNAVPLVKDPMKEGHKE